MEPSRALDGSQREQIIRAASDSFGSSRWPLRRLLAAVMALVWSVLDVSAQGAADQERYRRVQVVDALVRSMEGLEIDELEAQLTDSDPDVRAAAATVLGGRKDVGRSVRRALLAATRDADPLVRTQAVLAVSWTGTTPPLDETIRLLDDEDATVRIVALQLVPRDGRKAKEALPSVRALLHDADAFVRGSAAFATSRMGNAALAARADLEQLRGDPNEHVRMRAVEALRQIDADAIPWQDRRDLELWLNSYWILLALAVALVVAGLAIAIAQCRPRLRPWLLALQGLAILSPIVSGWAYELCYQPGGEGVRHVEGNFGCSVPLHFQIPAYLAIGLVPVALWSLGAAASAGAVPRRWVFAAWLAPVMCALNVTLGVSGANISLLETPLMVGYMLTFVPAAFALMLAPWLEIIAGAWILLRVGDTRLRLSAGVPIALALAGVALVHRGHLLTLGGRVQALVIGLVPGGLAVLVAHHLARRRASSAGRSDQGVAGGASCQ